MGWVSLLSAAQIQLSSIAEGGSTAAFTGLLLEGSGNPDVGVVLMHGRQSQPDGPVVRQLRQALNSAGYTTLSIDNPYAGVDSPPANGNFRDFADYVADVDSATPYAFPEAYARVRTAINHLQSLGVERVVVLGFSMGSRFMAAHVAHGQQQNELPIVGFIGIGMWANSVGVLNPANTLASVSVPVLDLYGDEDANAKNTALARVGAYNGEGFDYATVMLDCAAGLAADECHQLNGLKSTNGESCQPLEMAVLSWMIGTVPLANSQGRGVCGVDNGNPGGGDVTGNMGEGGGVLGSWFIVPLMFYVGKRVANTRRF
jgi:pimeloyl-ACP methyl ester carboxylesterase